MPDLPLFYHPNIGNSKEFMLPEDESKHCIRVLRLQADDQLYIVDGLGSLSVCTITNPHPKRCLVKVEQVTRNYGKRPIHLHIAMAPTKSIDRFEWFLEKATEIGVDEITPLLCEHSERKTIKPERLERVTVAAMKQSEKAYLPTINPLTKFDEFIGNTKEDTKLIAHCNPGSKTHINTIIANSSSILVLIGPEGDFTPNEVEHALNNGFSPTTLGSSRLRTETAGVLACALTNGMHRL